MISYFVDNNFDNALSSSQNPNGSKYIDVTSMLERNNKSDKSNDQPLSIVPKLRKVCEETFSKYQCSFQKGFSTQYCLIVRIEK